jgi:hypothetical protein
MPSRYRWHQPLRQHHGEAVFRWAALAGVYADRLHTTMPRSTGDSVTAGEPCRWTLTGRRTRMPGRYPVGDDEPQVLEALTEAVYITERQQAASSSVMPPWPS